MAETSGETTPLIGTYMDLRERGEGDVARTVEVAPGRLMLDVDEDGLVLGVETIGSSLTFADLFACLLMARFPGDSR